MKKDLQLPARLLSLLFILPLNLFAQCFTAPNGQKPATTQTIATCNGNFQTFDDNCFNGEYTKVNVVNQNTYTFKSSKPNDFITISDNNGTISFATGTGSVTWTANQTTEPVPVAKDMVPLLSLMEIKSLGLLLLKV